MFSFHKPKIYRSVQGCCICRAKSSSSRFTDSQRYEIDFHECFKIREERQGEICNACVLLVKRWKKLPSGSTRNWNHVVDARAGPGSKSITKIKNRVKDQLKEERKLYKHKHRYRPRPTMEAKTTRRSPAMSLPADDDSVGDEWGPPLTPDDSEMSEDDDDEVKVVRRRTRIPQKRKTTQPAQFSPFLDLTYWKKMEICCGIVFTGPHGELLLDANHWRPCRSCRNPWSSQSSQSGSSTASSSVADIASDDSTNDMPSRELTLPSSLDKNLPTPPDTQPSTPTTLLPDLALPSAPKALSIDLSDTCSRPEPFFSPRRHSDMSPPVLEPEPHCPMVVDTQPRCPIPV